MSIFAALLPIVGKVAGRVVENLFPDPAEAEKRANAKHAFVTELIGEAQAIELAAADIVKTEAASSHWLAANWRPLTMVTFVGLVVARMFGWTAPGLSEAEALHLWDIIELGLGGYVVGRTAEKLVPSITDAIKVAVKK